MRWIKEDIDAGLVKAMARRYDIDTLTASILARRKIIEPEQVLFFLEDDPRYMHNPFLFQAMEDAVDRILLAADEGEKILVFGDSDTDGVTSTTLMYEALSAMKLDVAYRVPKGEEPYGLSKEAVDDFAQAGGSLIITVDCGISNHEEVAHAADVGIDVIVCDHHRLQVDAPPEAVAVIDPKIDECGYPFRDLAGAGVAYKLASALRFAQTGLYKQPLALLNIGPAANPQAPSAAGVPENIGSGRYIIEAVKLHNLVETGRFSEILDEDSPKTASVLGRLARFLEGRSIFVWQKTAQTAMAHRVFGPNVDIESYDIADDAGLLFPECAGKTLAELKASSRHMRYVSGDPSEIDVFISLFAGIVMRKAGLPGEEEGNFMQLAALGTVADLMPLRDENRIIVRQGIGALNASPRKGIKELIQKLNLGKSLNATDAAWQITPLLNAAGRIGKPEIALQLLVSEDAAARMTAIGDIQQANSERKKLGADVWEAIYPIAKESYEKNSQRFVLVGSAFVKSGITGLLASRMVSLFKVPAIVAAFREDGTIVGSVRTANNLHISEMLSLCSELFLDYGGHDAAAGFSMQQGNWESFVSHATDFISNAKLNVAEETIAIDAELPHHYLRPELQKVYARFEPFGEDNPPLVFLARNVAMIDAQIIGKAAKNHLKLTLDFGQYKWPALLWDGAERLERDFSFRAREKIDILFKVTLNKWNGDEKPQLELYDVRRKLND